MVGPAPPNEGKSAHGDTRHRDGTSVPEAATLARRDEVASLRVQTPMNSNQPGQIWLVVDDLVVYNNTDGKMVGIFRYVVELERSLSAILGGGRVRFLSSAGAAFGVGHFGYRYREISREEFGWRCARLESPVMRSAQEDAPAERSSGFRPVYRRLMAGLPPRMHRHLRAFGKAQVRAVTSQARALVEFAFFLAALVGLPDPHFQSLRHAVLSWVRPWKPAPGDVVMVLGAGWFDLSLGAKLRRAQSQFGVRCAALVYDLIPINAPQFDTEPFGTVFETYINALVSTCSILFTISEFTKRELESYKDKYSARGPASQGIVALPTGSGLQHRSTGDRPLGLPAAGTYAVFVSSIEPRKNHAFAVEVWTHLYALLGEATPKLYFIGGVAPMLQQFVEDARRGALHGKAFEFLGRLSDSELNHMYDGSLFSFFPSLYEGWGLPVSESLARGIPCFASRSSALPEAGGELAIYIDIRDAEGTAKTIEGYVRDRDKLTTIRERISNEYRNVSFDDTARSLLAALAADAA
jgi:glycosyltransferase involved in cell wall biosynthesis